MESNNATSSSSAAGAAAAAPTISTAAAITTASTVTTTTATVPSLSSPSNCTNVNNNNTNSFGGTGSGSSATSLTLSASHTVQQQQAPLPQLLTAATIEVCQKLEEINNMSLASGLSEGQRSLSGAPSASSSPILSPQGKVFGRNANGTIVATSRPNNEAEIQLYRVLQRASLLAYYDTLLEMGGDDVQQLCDAGEEEFLEIMALVGMASKPLHVRRLQKSLYEWANNPALFQSNVLPGASGSLCETPPKPGFFYNADTTPVMNRHKFTAFNASNTFHPTPLLNTVPHTNPALSTSASTSTSAQIIAQICSPVVSSPLIQSHTPLGNTLPASNISLQPSGCTPTATTTQSANVGSAASGSTMHQVSSSSPQLTPVLTEFQVQRITLGAEKIARQLPQREPRAHTSKKRTTRELEQVIAMNENDPRRMDEIRKYSAIYGRFDCKRRPEKPLTLHEVCVNEAAAQLCRLVPALLTRRDELFPLARQIVKDAGFGHSASIARYGGLLSQAMQAQSCESNLEPTLLPAKRQRLSSAETKPTTLIDQNREVAEDSRYNLFAMYQKFAKPPFDLTEIAKFSKVEFDDNDNDSRFSFSNSSSPSMPANGAENERDRAVTEVGHGRTLYSTSSVSTTSQLQSRNNNYKHYESVDGSETADLSSSPSLSGVQVISAAGGNIIAVANPALALSPTLNEVLTLKRNANSPESQ